MSGGAREERVVVDHAGRLVARRRTAGSESRAAEIVTILCEVGAERRQRQILKDDAAHEPGRDLQRHHRDGDDRDEANEAEAGGREDRRGRRQQHQQQDDAEDPGDLAHARAQEAHDASPSAAAQPDVVDRHHDLRHEVEEVDERDPDDDGARRGRRDDRPPQQHADVVGERVAAEEQARSRRRP